MDGSPGEPIGFVVAFRGGGCHGGFPFHSGIHHAIEWLAGASRSARAYLARALKVSVRELEALAAGRIQWINDERRVDFDRLCATKKRPSHDKIPTAKSCDATKGIPILGRVLESGTVEHFDYWTPEEGRRVPVRYPGLPDVFSLELTCDVPPFMKGQCLVFQPILPGEIRDGELMLVTLSDRELCRVYHTNETTLRLQSALLPAAGMREVPIAGSAASGSRD